MLGQAKPAAAVPAPATALAAEGLPSRFCCFVTGTDTEIGKTLVSAAILHKLVEAGQRACGMKPIAAGAELVDGELRNEDADMLAAAGNHCSALHRSAIGGLTLESLGIKEGEWCFLEQAQLDLLVPA